ncbi:reverse transcriptase domain-containing protein, partial [Salmonella enterica]|uniref:reverse transcriptase domain-containing protein n=1 Tax=Salmonella enterica TaxID=28901 RepID=UPI00352421E1
ELNGLKIRAGDIGNAYLEAFTKEKVYFIAGRAFKELEGHTMIVVKALYGLRTSGARFHDRLADTLRELGFFPCKNEPDLWMRDMGEHYEYVCVYVDDLLVIMQQPDEFFKVLIEVYGYKLKGVG